MSDDVGGDLTRDEVRSVIETFWRLDADKAHLADFLPIMDDEFVIRAVSEAGEEVVRFDGLAGLEDHQDGKMDIFDEVFELTSFRFDTGPVAIAHTTCVDLPQARAARRAQRGVRRRPRPRVAASPTPGSGLPGDDRPYLRALRVSAWPGTVGTDWPPGGEARQRGVAPGSVSHEGRRAGLNRRESPRDSVVPGTFASGRADYSSEAGGLNRSPYLAASSLARATKPAFPPCG